MRKRKRGKRRMQTEMMNESQRRRKREQEIDKKCERLTAEDQSATQQAGWLLNTEETLKRASDSSLTTADSWEAFILKPDHRELSLRQHQSACHSAADGLIPAFFTKHVPQQQFTLTESRYRK